LDHCFVVVVVVVLLTLMTRTMEKGGSDSMKRLFTYNTIIRTLPLLPTHLLHSNGLLLFVPRLIPEPHAEDGGG
jgi:hypothetical protein